MEQTIRMREKAMTYAVLNPRGVRQPIKRTALSSRLTTLEGKTVYFVAQDRPFFSEEVSKHLAAALPNTKVVYRKKPGWIRDTDQELWQEIYDNADALVYGTCMGAGSGMSAVTWLGLVEKRGIPCVYLAGELYERDLNMSAVMRGLPALRTVFVKLVGEEDVTADVAEAQFAGIVSQLQDALTVPLTEEEKRADDIVTEKPPRIAMSGTYEEVQDYFAAQGWSDGLPIVPPTEEKVAEMLTGTSHGPDEIVTTCMHPEELTVTVEKVAVVGAMAGCKPEYMPVLLSIIETWGSSPVFGQACRSDSTFSVMTLVNGPIRNELGMNKGSNAMGPGCRPNATIGRCLRLAIFALGGSVPGASDMSTQGSPIKYGWCFPEHEEESPWEPFHVSQGFRADESVVSLWAGGWCHWSFSGDLDHLATAIGTFPQVSGAVLMSLEAARLYHRVHKLSKADIEKYVLEHARQNVMNPKPTWYNIDMGNVAAVRKDRASEQNALQMPDFAVRVIVVGGETSIPIAQAWHLNPPVCNGIDKWR
jgi:hypothetical protein